MPRPLGPRKHMLHNWAPAPLGGRFSRRCVNCGLLGHRWDAASHAAMYTCTRPPEMVMQRYETERSTCNGWRK